MDERLKDIEIKNRWTGAVIRAGKYADIRAAIQQAVESRADLSGANLTGADLSGANLSGANLSGANLSRVNLSRVNLYGANLSRVNLFGADLTGADLYGADLYGADLSGVNLSRVNLSGANLSRADLSGANLYRANLSGANLSGANLYGANLSRVNLSRVNLYGANLSRADLSGAKNITIERTSPLAMLLDQPGPIRAYKIVKSNCEGPYNGGIIYEVGKTYRVDNADTNPNELCGTGIHLASLDWCMKNWCESYRILVVEFLAQDIACIPLGTDGKFRVRKCTVVGEKDLAQLGLVRR